MNEIIHGVIREVNPLVKELSEMSVAPHVDYTVEGLGQLAACLLEARAFSERAAAIQSEVIGLVAQARQASLYAEGIYQDVYDDIVEQNHIKYSNLSWEERYSLYRTKSIDATMSIRETRAGMIEVEAKAQQVETLSRSLYRARGDLQAVVQTMRAGETLGELRE